MTRLRNDERVARAWRALEAAGELDTAERAELLAVIQRQGGHPLHGAWCRLADMTVYGPGAEPVPVALKNNLGEWWRLRAGGDNYWPTVGPPAKRVLAAGRRPTTWDGEKGADWWQFEPPWWGRAKRNDQLEGRYQEGEDEALRMLLEWLAPRLVELRPESWRPE